MSFSTLKSHIAAIALAVSLSFTCAVLIADETVIAKAIPAPLSKVMLVGDSITASYYPLVANNLAGRAVVVKNPYNGLTAAHTHKRIKRWLRQAGRVDLVHWNNGLQDIGREEYSILEYSEFLRGIIVKIHAADAKIIWASTTPVHLKLIGRKYREGEIERFNGVATHLMQLKDIPVNDLYKLVAKSPAKIYQPDGLHFNLEGMQILAAAVTRSIESHLPIHTPTTEQAGSLPAVLLLGDTFSAERYHGTVSRLLSGKARVLLPPNLKKNSTNVLAALPQWLKITGELDLVYWNCGLYDLCHIPTRKPERIALENYLENLKGILKLLRDSGAQVVWATTTPIDAAKRSSGNGWWWDNSEISKFNEAASKLMNKEGVLVSDLHAHVATNRRDYLQSSGRHLTAAGAERCGQVAADAIALMLKYNE